MMSRYGLPKIAFLTAVLSALGACSQPGGQTNYSYKGIEADYAASRILSAGSSEEARDVIGKVRSEAQFGFRWTHFWERLAGAGALGRLAPESRVALLNLQEFSCAEGAFQAYSRLVLTDPAYLGYLAGEGRVCETPLRFEELDRSLEVLSAGLENQNPAAQSTARGRIAALLVREQRLGNSIDWRPLLSRISGARWVEIGQNLLGGTQVAPLADLIRLHYVTFGRADFSEAVFAPIVGNPQRFSALVDRLGSQDVLGLLRYSPVVTKSQPTVQASTWQANLDALGRDFQRRSGQGVAPANWGELWNQYLGLRDFERRVGGAGRGTERLAWLEGILRAVERELRRDPERAKQFLARENDSLDRIWLEYRIDRQLIKVDAERLGKQEVRDELERLWKIRLDLARDWSQRELHDGILNFCKEIGAEVTSLGRPQVGLAADELRRPGCWELTETTEEKTKEKVEWRAGAYTQGFFSVLFTNGRNLDLEADAIDASVIDSTALRVHPDLPVEPTPASADAIVLPFVLGLRIQDPEAFAYGAGIHYFLYHYVARSPEAGAASSVAPAKGFGGGNLRVAARSTNNSYLPIVVGIGGPGQRGAPRRAGGRASRSELSWSKARSDLRNSAPPAGAENQQAIPIPPPSLITLGRLFEAAERNPNDGRIRVYLNASLYRSWLSPEQVEKFNRICSGASFEACMESLLPRAAAQLEALSVAAVPNLGAEAVLDEVQTGEFRVADGALGPENPAGAEGDAGEIQISGFRE